MGRSEGVIRTVLPFSSEISIPYEQVNWPIVTVRGYLPFYGSTIASQDPDMRHLRPPKRANSLLRYFKGIYSEIESFTRP